MVLSEELKVLKAFRTSWGLFEFTVMPFGLHGASATFQRLMDQVLYGLANYAGALLDDIIYSGTWGTSTDSFGLTEVSWPHSQPSKVFPGQDGDAVPRLHSWRWGYKTTG